VIGTQVLQELNFYTVTDDDLYTGMILVNSSL